MADHKAIVTKTQKGFDLAESKSHDFTNQMNLLEKKGVSLNVMFGFIMGFCFKGSNSTVVAC
jgi:hypothetical protein